MSVKFTAQELNYLIYRYLEESGFKLTTLAFKTETQIDKLDINPEDVQRGALITYILKGLQYRDIEVHSNPDGTITNCEAIVPLIGKHACKRSMDHEPLVITTPIPNSYKTNEANQNLNDDLAKQQSQKDLAKNQSGKKVAQKQIKSNKNQIDSIDSPELVKKSQGELNKITSISKRSIRKVLTSKTKKDQDSLPSLQDPININNEIPITRHSINETTTTSSTEIIKPLIDDEYTTLEGHVGEVYFCKWHPNDPNVLATAGRDSVLRIWKTDHQGNFTDALKMGNDEFYYDNFICSVDWSPNGKLIAASYFRGVPKIWTDRGCLKTILDFNKNSVTRIKWNPSGSLIITAGCDKIIILWEAYSTTIKKSYCLHKETITDLVWKNDMIFASCSYDKSIYIYDITKENPIEQYLGHEDKIFCLAWDPSKKYLASGSADKTVRIWTDNHKEPLHVLQHKSGINLLSWSPCISSKNSAAILAISTKDEQISIWNAINGQFLHITDQLSKPIKSITWHPKGEWLAYGSTDSTARFLSLKNKEMSCCAPFSIIDLAWNMNGSKIAASLGNGKIVVWNWI
nr:3153_t:CDS:10 [Entrophospora candida]